MNHDVSTPKPVLSHLKPRILSRHSHFKESVAGSTLEISISNSCAILAAGTASPNSYHPKSGLLGPPQEGKGRNNNLSPPNIVSNSMISPPFQEVLARSVRALMPLAAMMRSFFCICEELDPAFASWKISDLIMNHRGDDIYKGFLKVFEM